MLHCGKWKEAFVRPWHSGTEAPRGAVAPAMSSHYLFIYCSSAARCRRGRGVPMRGDIPLCVMVRFVNTIKKKKKKKKTIIFRLFRWIFFVFSLLAENVLLESAAKVTFTEGKTGDTSHLCCPRSHTPSLRISGLEGT